jgi:hypothetical protein
MLGLSSTSTGCTGWQLGCIYKDPGSDNVCYVYDDAVVCRVRCAARRWISICKHHRTNGLGCKFRCPFWFSSRAKRLLVFEVAFAAACGSGIGLYLLLFVWMHASAIQHRALIVALIGQSWNVSSILSPVRAIYVASRDKDTKRVPGAIAVINCAKIAAWIAYGALLPNGGDPWVYGPNVIGLVLSLAQIIVLGILYFRIKQVGSAANPSVDMTPITTGIGGALAAQDAISYAIQLETVGEVLSRENKKPGFDSVEQMPP